MPYWSYWISKCVSIPTSFIWNVMKNTPIFSIFYVLLLISSIKSGMYIQCAVFQVTSGTHSVGVKLCVCVLCTLWKKKSLPTYTYLTKAPAVGQHNIHILLYIPKIHVGHMQAVMPDALSFLQNGTLILGNAIATSKTSRGLPTMAKVWLETWLLDTV